MINRIRVDDQNSGPAIRDVQPVDGWFRRLAQCQSRQAGQCDGFATVAYVHHVLDISDTQREHWIAHILAPCQDSDLPADVMAFFEPHIYFGARAAQGSSRRLDL